MVQKVGNDDGSGELGVAGAVERDEWPLQILS